MLSYKVYCLFVLFLIHLNAQWQQYFLVYVRQGNDPFTNFQVDIGISNAQYGVLSGTVFTMTNSFAGILLGYQVDRYNRKYILIMSCVAWNLV